MGQNGFNQSIEVKLVAAGDGCVGKTCLLMCYAYNRFPTEYLPTVFDTYTVDVVVDGHSINVGLWDTAGQEDYDRLRPLSYANASVFVACFNLTDRDSFQNIESKWVPELRHYLKKAPIILVGCKKDLRAEGAKGGAKFISEEEGRRMAKRLKCDDYVECSAKTLDGVHDVFNSAVRAVLTPNKKGPNSLCSLL